MRHVNVAQRFANVVANVRACAIVAGNVMRLRLQHLLHALLGTSSKSKGLERPEIYSWSQGWMGIARPKMVPATYAITSPATRDRSN